MSKKRVIACLILRDGIVVQSIGFGKYLPVGKPEIAARFLDSWGVDEIVLLDITARREGRRIPVETVARVSSAIHAPLTVGGGLSGVADVREVIQAGADKISVNGLLLDEPAAVGEIANSFGVQCVVASIDVKTSEAGAPMCMGDGGRVDTGIAPDELARRAADAGAGEILLNSVDRDGMRTGYDLELVERVAGAVDIPVIALGGAGHPEHMDAVLRGTSATAAAAANFLHYTEHSVASIKSAMRNAGRDVRLDSEADYRHIGHDPDGRPGRRPDQELIDEIFEFIPREVI